MCLTVSKSRSSGLGMVRTLLRIVPGQKNVDFSLNLPELNPSLWSKDTEISCQNSTLIINEKIRFLFLFLFFSFSFLFLCVHFHFLYDSYQKDERAKPGNLLINWCSFSPLRHPLGWTHTHTLSLSLSLSLLSLSPSSQVFRANRRNVSHIFTGVGGWRDGSKCNIKVVVDGLTLPSREASGPATQ